MPEDLVRTVSDTAHWVAACRAVETARPDALFKDPFAARLAGERGRAIAAKASWHSQWALVARTCLIDAMVLEAVGAGVDRILNLAAGLDTRPYRLPLPPGFEWVEADLPGIIDEKEAALAGETPVCRLSRHRVDLADAAARAAFLDEATRGAGNVMVITEGLVIYLDDAAVAGLSDAFLAVPAVRHWVLDFNSPKVLQRMMQSMRHMGNAPFRFAPPDGLSWFEARGWRTAQDRSLLKQAAQTRRLPLWMRLLSRLPQPEPRQPKGMWSVVAHFVRG